MNKLFKIGTFCFSVEYPDSITIPDHLMEFHVEEETPAYSYQILTDLPFPEPEGRLTARREDLLVYEQQGLETRYIGLKGVEGYYACYQECSPTSATVYVDLKRTLYLSVDPIFNSFFALERHVLSLDSIVLHSAYIEHEGQAILFSAPSETGKTTQAGLWEKYRGSRTINGDRSLLRKIDGQWHAGGWPVCGTSEICQNITLPIKAIVMLSQAPDNTVRTLHPMRAFSLVYSQITINRWNQDGHTKAMNLIEQLISEVPVYHLACNISEDAVACLEQALYK